MTKNKTEETQQSVLEFLDAVPDEKKGRTAASWLKYFKKRLALSQRCGDLASLALVRIIISMRVDMKETHLYLDFHLGRVPSHCI